MKIPKGYDQALARHGRGEGSYLVDNDGNIVWRASDSAANFHGQADSDEALSQVKTAENLQAYLEQITEPRGRGKWVCPLCGSGNGPNHTAAFNVSPDGVHWKCFSCGAGGDVLDLIGAVEGIEGYADRLDRAAEIFGIDTGTPRPATAASVKVAAPPKIATTTTDYSVGQAKERAYVAECKKHIELAADYLKARGWTVEEAKEYGLGYDQNKKRLILPWAGSDYYHTDRATDDSTKPKYIKPPSELDPAKPWITAGDIVGPQPIYNPTALDKPAFIVVEGAMDALAVMRCGVDAVVALGGSGYNRLLDELSNRHYQGCVVLALDNDGTGKKNQAELADKLAKSGIACIPLDYGENNPHKDIDDLVRADKAVATRFLSDLMDSAAQTAEETDHNPNMRLHDPAKVVEGIYNAEDADEPIPTGFASLDTMIGGGLMRGLYIIGATSSFGKTTISVQIADHLAASGQPVLLVTIEQSAREIAAKSLSRLTHDRHSSHNGGLTEQEIKTSTNRKAWTQDKWNALYAATNAYTEMIAPNLRILEGLRRPSVADVAKAVEAMTAKYGKPPVVVLDYLQLLAAANERDSDKQTVDHNVTALRLLANALKTPVWCVATLNRESYSGPVDLDSFKESGSIEYGADYLFGLQPRGIAAEVDGVKSAVEKKLKGNAFVSKAKRDNPRKVELTILKNRQGATTGNDKGIPLTYWPRTNLFEEG